MQTQTERRVHSAELKAAVLAECQEAGASVAAVALRHGLNANLVRKWLVGRGLKKAGLVAPRADLEKNGDALFTWWHRVMDDHKPNTALRVGFKRMVDEQGDPLKFDAASDYVDARAPTGERSTDAGLIEYLVMPEAFKHEVCKGLDAHFVAKVLKEAGCLKHEAGRDTIRQRLPGIGKAPVFHILPSVFADEGDEL